MPLSVLEPIEKGTKPIEKGTKRPRTPADAVVEAVELPEAYPFVYGSPEQAAESMKHWAAMAMQQIAIAVAPGEQDGIPMVILSKEPDAATVTVDVTTGGWI